MSGTGEELEESVLYPTPVIVYKCPDTIPFKFRVK